MLKFKTTQEAFAFGRKATPKQIGTIQANRMKTYSAIERASIRGDMTKIIELSATAQLYSEAVVAYKQDDEWTCSMNFLKAASQLVGEEEC